MTINLPLMENNITRSDLDALVAFLQGEPILTQSSKVREFESRWSDWLGVKHGVFVNSGSSANLLTMAALRHLRGEGEVIVPPLTWVSDITAVLCAGLKPVFVDINPRTLAMDDEQIIANLSDDTRAVFLTHVLGFNGLTRRLIDELASRGIPLIEDVCESHGASFEGKRLGSYGLVSNFSYYYAHHMSTIEGGMVSTNDSEIYELVRMWRSHGMVREASDESIKQRFVDEYPDLNPDFIFAVPGYNVRSTELNAVIGLEQIERLDGNNEKRVRNLRLFLDNLDSEKYRTDFDTDGAVNYALLLVLKEKDDALMAAVSAAMREAKVEFRRGASGGGNQLRQPYLKKLMPEGAYERYPETDHIHFYGCYIGNYPGLSEDKILQLCELLNAVSV